MLLLDQFTAQTDGQTDRRTDRRTDGWTDSVLRRGLSGVFRCEMPSQEDRKWKHLLVVLSMVFIGVYCTVQSSLWSPCGVPVVPLWCPCGVPVGQPSSHQRNIQNRRDLQELFSLFLIL